MMCDTGFLMLDAGSKTLRTLRLSEKKEKDISPRRYERKERF
jgi:hypothetical protein